MRGTSLSAAVATALSPPRLPLLKPYSLPLAGPNPCRHHYCCTSSSSSAFLSSTNLEMAKPLDEADVGVTCYVSSLPGFRGILKQRYADFIVREVDCDGTVVRLTSFDLPAEDWEENEGKVPDSVGGNYAEAIESFRSLAGEVDAEMLERFVGGITDGVEKNPGFIILSPDADKTHRAEVHNFFKKNFRFLITDTVEESGNVKRIRVRYCPEEGGGQGRSGRKRKERGDKGRRDNMPFDSRGSDNWQEHLGKFLRFHLYKENKDTQEALGVLGKMLGIQPRSFGFAGTKDKRSISTQRVTVFKIHAKRLAALNSRLIGIRVGNFSYVREGLVLGKLMGNHFTITLRGVIGDSEDTIKAAADGLGRNGFINYYGLQRFGSGSVPTHLIGAALLRGEWKVAVGLVLDPRDGERREIREAREYYKQSGDIDGTLRQLPRYLVAEKSILQCLKKCPGNYLQALRAIPRTLRMMYVHSYQSYLWNHAASMRVQKHGIDQVVLGDLVFRKGSFPDKFTEVDYVEPQDGNYEDAHNNDMDEISESSDTEGKMHPVKAVTAEDLLEGCYTFDNVVLPLPGSRIIYPENDIADVYHKLAEKDAISLTESAHGAKEFSITSMTGGYRQVFQQPMDFEWELLKYSDVTIPLAESDLAVISKTKTSSIVKAECLDNGRYSDEQDDNRNNNVGSLHSSEVDAGEVKPICSSDGQSPQVALKLGFTLPASCYATMAIRELLKSSTSVRCHDVIPNNGIACNNGFTSRLEHDQTTSKEERIKDQGEEKKGRCFHLQPVSISNEED